MATGSAAVLDVPVYKIEYLIRAGNDGYANRASGLITITICFDRKTGLFVGAVPSDVMEHGVYATHTHMVAGYQRDSGSKLLVRQGTVLRSYKKNNRGKFFDAMAEIRIRESSSFIMFLSFKKDRGLIICLTQAER